jgi:hypothetical protein
MTFGTILLIIFLAAADRRYSRLAIQPGMGLWAQRHSWRRIDRRYRDAAHGGEYSVKLFALYPIVLTA